MPSIHSGAKVSIFDRDMRTSGGSVTEEERQDLTSWKHTKKN